MNELVKVVEFKGDKLKVAKHENGKIYVGVSSVCTSIGFDKNAKDSQVKKVKTDYVLNRGCVKFNAGLLDDDNEAIGIELDFLPIWLAKINITPNIIETNPQLAERLFEYQMQAKDVLAEAFIDSVPKIPKTYAEALLEAGRLAMENEKLELEVKQKDEVITKVKEEVKAKVKVIDDITKDVDTPLLCKTVTDYINVLHHKTREPHQMIYKKIYDVLGRRLNKDIPYRKSQYEQSQRDLVINNIAYNKENDLKGEDRKFPFRMKDANAKLSILEYIVDVLGEGHALIETIAKLADVGIEDVIEKYNYYKNTDVDLLG